MKHLKYALIEAGIFLTEDPQRTRLILVGAMTLLGLALTLLGAQAPGGLLAGPADGGDGGMG